MDIPLKCIHHVFTMNVREMTVLRLEASEIRIYGLIIPEAYYTERRKAFCSGKPKRVAKNGRRL